MKLIALLCGVVYATIYGLILTHLENKNLKAEEEQKEKHERMLEIFGINDLEESDDLNIYPIKYENVGINN